MLAVLLIPGLHAPEVDAQGAATYYVRPDGGSHEQCTGLTDAAYPGTGTNQPCAWDHPFRALPPDGSPRLPGGATLVIGDATLFVDDEPIYEIKRAKVGTFQDIAYFDYPLASSRSRGGKIDR